MKIGDLVYDPWSKQKGLIVGKDYVTSIGTPFDWEVLLFSGSIEGFDTRQLELISERV